MLPPLKEMVAALVGRASVSSTLPQWDQGNREVIDLLAGWCEALGFDTRVQHVSGEGASAKFNLIARVGPGEQPGLVFSGHTDTVPYDSQRWNSDPFRLIERESRWYGLGVADMKAFFAILLHAVAPLIHTLARPVVLIATCDEESSMSGVRALARELPGLNAAVIIGEPTSLQPIHAHKGILMEELELIGQSGHSSDPAMGRNAIDAMHAALAAMMQLRTEWSRRLIDDRFQVSAATLNFGCIHGGDNPNRICSACRLQFDVRLMPGMDASATREEIRERIEPIAVQHGVQMRLSALIEGVPPFSGRVDSRLVQRCEQAAGQSASTVSYATEAPFFEAAGLDTVVLGPGSIRQAHQPDEYLALEQIDPALRIYRQLVQEYCIHESVVT